MTGEMDHDEVRELLDERRSSRTASSDSWQATRRTRRSSPGHLAGCMECAAELERLRRSVGLIRDAVRAVPPPDLRERTLAFVAAVGVDRTARAWPEAPAASGSQQPRPGCPGAAARAPPRSPSTSTQRAAAGRLGIGRVAGWAVAIAAGIVLALVATSAPRRRAARRADRRAGRGRQRARQGRGLVARDPGRDRRGARRARLDDRRRLGHRDARLLADHRPSRRPCAGTRATAGRDGVPLLGGEWGRADADRQDVLCRRYRLLGR